MSESLRVSSIERVLEVLTMNDKGQHRDQFTL
jgi:hypothetical protein